MTVPLVIQTGLVASNLKKKFDADLAAQKKIEQDEAREAYFADLIGVVLVT